MTDLISAARYGDIVRVKLLLDDKHINVNLQDKFGWTALHCASWNGHLEIVQLLLQDERIDVNIQEENGRTALDVAIRHNKTNVAKLLIQYKKAMVLTHVLNTKVPIELIRLIIT